MRGRIPSVAALAVFSAALCFAEVRSEAGGTHRVDESFFVSASSRTVWAVLTDYDRMHEFISSMESSRVRQRSPLTVEQQTTGRFLFIKHKIKILLKIHEEPFHLIEFEDAGGENFERYAGSWQIREAPGGSEVTYRLTAKSKSHVPAWVSRTVFKSVVHRLLGEVRSEILSREKITGR